MMLSELDEEEDYLNQPIDPNRVPPMHQKRLLAFVNHFIVETVDFLNRLITNCDLKFVAFETKLGKVEDSLAILEAKLSSVPELADIGREITNTPSESISRTNNEVEEMNEREEHSLPTVIETAKDEDDQQINSEATAITPEIQSGGVKANEDYRYKKFFKMIHFGVLPQAVKDKAGREGLDPSVLDNPNQILADGRRTPPEQSSEEDDSS